ncbi:hypothetical protein AQ16_5847 (plasmid) [Bacillus cereus G9241]|nr:hypothetical protein AQ16_5847 [Bacillus cereus G9241]
MVMGFLYSKYIITCKNAMSHSDGTLTFERAFEHLSLKRLPTKIDFYLVVGLDYSLGSDDDLSISFEITDPNDDLLAEGVLLDLEPVEFENSAFVANITNLKNVPVKKRGLYTIYIKHQGRVICKQDILISKGREDS